MMNLNDLIKNKCAVRDYKRIKISSKKIKKILDAGMNSSSIHGFQPWRFFAISNDKLIKKISKICLNKAKTLGIGANIMLKSTARTIEFSPFIIVVLNSKDFSTKAKIFRNDYIEIASICEIQAISASIQNMMLVAESLNIGSCWISMPLFSGKDIVKLLNARGEFLAIISFGYPIKVSKRSKRLEKNEVVKEFF